MATTSKSMGPAQVIAWLGAIVLAFLGLVMGLLAFYRTEMLQQRVANIEEEKTTRQTELMVEIRDLLRDGQNVPVDTHVDAPGHSD